MLLLKQVCVQLPASAAGVTLPAVAAADAVLLLSAGMQQTLAGLRCCRLAAVRPAGRRYRVFAACRRSAAAAPQQQLRAVSRRQPTQEAEHRLVSRAT